jgi:YfiH family protein
VGDDPGAVSANWARWRAVYPQFRVAVLEQTHSSRVHVIGAGERPGCKIGDGMVTGAPGIVLAIFTADCVPVLMFDDQARVAGALHAGWRGTLAGITAHGVKAMMGLGARARSLRVALGPSIGSCCFEVDSELADRFVLQIPPASRFCRDGRPGKKYLDLRGILRTQLQAAGICPASILDIGPCTRCNSDRFFSRRAAAGARTGLQMSFIGFEPER